MKEARQQLAENRESFQESDPILFHLLETKLLSETEKNLLLTEIFQGGIDAVIIPDSDVINGYAPLHLKIFFRRAQY